MSQNSEQIVGYRQERLQIWGMSFVCVWLLLFALAASTRMSLYWQEGLYGHLLSVLLFDCLVLIGLAINISSYRTE